MTGNELKKEIVSKTSLKSRDLSVRNDGGSYTVYVKTLTPLSVVKEVAKKHESYQRDERSGEILSGGNTFVFVNYMSWDRSKNEPFKVEVPSFLVHDVESLLKYFQSSSWCGDFQSRFVHLAKKASSLDFFKNWTEDDVSSALGLICQESSLINDWVNNGPSIETV